MAGAYLAEELTADAPSFVTSAPAVNGTRCETPAS